MPCKQQTPTAEAQHLLAFRRAVAVASSSLREITTNPYTQISDFVRVSKQLIELDADLIKCQSQFAQVYEEMTPNQQMQILFDLIDEDGGGTVNLDEFRRGLQKVGQGHLPVIRGLIPLVEKNSVFFDDSGGMSCDEFGCLLREHCADCNSPLSELLEMLVSQICLAESGDAIIRTVLAILLGDSPACREPSRVQAATEEARLLLLFDAMDNRRRGHLRLKEVVKHILRFTEEMNMDTGKQQVLLALEENDRCSLEYPAFAELLRNVALSQGSSISVRNVCDAMTLSLCRQNVSDEDLKHLFLESQALLSKESSCSTITEDFNFRDEQDSLEVEFPSVEALEKNSRTTTNAEFGKLDRLFDLWDRDHDGSLSLSEIALGMRKFQKTKSLNSTVESSIVALTSCDKNNDNKLDREEFVLLVTKLARASDTDVRRLVDFMVVQSALEDSEDEEVTFFSKLSVQRLLKDGMTRLLPQRNMFSKIFRRLSAVSGKKRGDEECCTEENTSGKDCARRECTMRPQ